MRVRGIVDFDLPAIQRKLGVELRRQAGQPGAGSYTRMQGVIKQANEEGLQFLQRQAQENLDAKMASNPRQRIHTGDLRAAIGNDKYSLADKDRIAFLIHNRIQKDVPYYAAIEFGSDYWVGKELPFRFLGFGGDRRSGVIVGPRQARRMGLGNRNSIKITIRNPVPAYHYATDAGRVLLATEYKKILKRVAAEHKVKLVSA